MLRQKGYEVRSFPRGGRPWPQRRTTLPMWFCCLLEYFRDSQEYPRDFSLRCLRGSERFCASIWSLHAARYARCPKCLRMDLSTWTEEFYRPASGTRMLLRTGATLSMEISRCNFASFRLCGRSFPGIDGKPLRGARALRYISESVVVVMRAVTRVGSLS
jgi:hypothetical protein